ncbi:MAG TPA: M20/M25/M40 family metallo-hydrolase [Polyangiaceae bacterium]|nr:M20/M25/M40 family metallo-hydrolase [Polyangiaceae bacterium]
MLALNQKRFIDILSQLIAMTPQLQNSPDVGLVPEERLPAELVLSTLKPHIDSGFIEAESLAAPGHEARPSLVLTVKGTGEGQIGFVGAHFDVVPADREKEGWERDPFTLWVGDDGTLYARGVTDCLGHVAVVTDLLAQMAEANQRPRRTLKVVFIANEEEAPLPEIGLDYVVDQGKLDDLKDGTIYWLDSADFGPTVGTGGVAMWELRVAGVTGHSGMTHNCVNALELAGAASQALTHWFHSKFPPHPDEERWGFVTSSTLKATIIDVPNNKITKVPGTAVVQGDIRLTPFYDIEEAIGGAVKFIEELDARIDKDDAPRGFPRTRTVGGVRGKLKLTRKGRFMEGIACHLDSPGLARLTKAISDARGEEAKAYSMTGSLPLVRDLQRRGFDVQITGFGRSTYYHAPNEQAKLEHFVQGFDILRRLLAEE